MTRVVHPLIHDWNGETGGPGLSVMLDDETLRDGLQSPSVCMPSFEQKVEILHQMEALGIDTVIASGYPHLEEAYRVSELLFPELGLPGPHGQLRSSFGARHVFGGGGHGGNVKLTSAS